VALQAEDEATFQPIDGPASEAAMTTALGVTVHASV
jgi:hypothetical protein